MSIWRSTNWPRSPIGLGSVGIVMGMLLGQLPEASGQSLLWSAEQAQHHGLVRAWYAQVQMDPSRSRVQHFSLYQDTFLVQTDRAGLHALEAETGRTQWAQVVGSPDLASLPPAMNEQLVAVVNGGSLFILNRIDGKILWKRKLSGFPGAGPSLGNARVYVPMLQGLIYCYPLVAAKDPREALGHLRAPRPKQEKLTPEQRRRQMAEFRISQEKIDPLLCQSTGRTMVPVVVGFSDRAQEYVAWPSHLGYLFIGILDIEAGKFTIRHRLETHRTIAAPPAYRPARSATDRGGGVFYVANQDGYVWAVQEKTGEVLWKFASGRMIDQSPVWIDNQVFVATVDGGLYCLDADTGTPQWHLPEPNQFVAASNQRVYAADRFSRLYVLDRAKGTPLDKIWLPGHMLFTNTQTDRIYIVSPIGLVQCLREIQLQEPIRHGAGAKPKQPPPIHQEPVPMPKQPGPAAQPTPIPGLFEKPPSEKQPDQGGLF